jgi:hypothetical protein
MYTYEVHQLTGAALWDGGRVTGGESAGVVSRHRSLAAARRECDGRNRNRMGPRCEVRRRLKDEAGSVAEPVSDE